MIHDNIITIISVMIIPIKKINDKINFDLIIINFNSNNFKIEIAMAIRVMIILVELNFNMVNSKLRHIFIILKILS